MSAKRESYPDRESWMMGQLLKRVDKRTGLQRLAERCPDRVLRDSLLRQARADVAEGFCPTHRTPLIRRPDSGYCPACRLNFAFRREEPIHVRRPGKGVRDAR